jgi:hypothetical protein
VATPAQSINRRESPATSAAARFALSPGKALLRFTSYDAQGEVLDRWPEDLTVPAIAKDPLALATPRFYVARSAFELRRLREATDASPSASRRLRKTDRLLVELEYYSAGATPELVTELLNQKGESLVTLPVPAATDNKTRFELPLQSLAPAVYVLRVRARTPDRQVEQHEPFRIVP